MRRRGRRKEYMHATALDKASSPQIAMLFFATIKPETPRSWFLSKGSETKLTWADDLITYASFYGFARQVENLVGD